jgi:hypothetical protein
MNTSFKKIAIHSLVVAALAAGTMGTANARVWVVRTRVVVAPVVAAPVVVVPAVAAPVIAAPVVVAPVVAAPVVVAPVYVPTCRLVSVPFVNAYTGVTYFVARRVCN